MSIARAHGWGPEVSPLMVVSDYPTQDDLTSCKSLSGASGKLVNDLLKSQKYHLDRCYKTCYFKCALPGYNSKSKKKSREAITLAKTYDNWDEILIQEIIDIAPNVILALGELPLQFLTGEKLLRRFRGSILPLEPNLRATINQKIGKEVHIKVIPAFHPRDIFPDPTSYVYTQLDYAKALRFLNNRAQFKEPGILWIARTAEALIEFWKRAKHGEFLTTDIETYNNFPTCASLCADGQEAVSFPLFNSTLSTMENVCIIRKYAEILQSKIPKVNQNILYDWSVLERMGFTLNNIAGDTMLAANVIYPELPKGLDFLTSVYTDVPYYKDEGKDYDPKLHDFDRMLYYNAKDALTTWQVWKAQQQDMEDLKVKHFYFNFIHPLFFHYKKISDRGILVDDEKRIQLLEKYYNLLEVNAKELFTVYGKELNVRSSKQVGIFIYDFLNCPKHTHITPTGKEIYSTDEDTLVNMYLNEISDDIIKKILKQIIFCRKIESVINMLETPYHRDQRMRTTYNIAGTNTGRTSTGQAIGWYYTLEERKIKQTKYGTAFQKIPKHGFEFEHQVFGEDIREIFVPTPGYEFFGFDGANAEGRVVCILADDDETLDYIEAGNNIHKLTASWIYNKPIEFIKKGSQEYNLGKRARHAGHLGQSGAGLSTQVYKSVKFCNEVMKKFHTNAPKIQGVFQYQVSKLIEQERVLINPFGRRRDFFGLSKNNKHDVFKEGYSYLPQGTVSDHFKLTSLKLAEKAEWALEIFEAHDGLLYEIPKGRREEFGQLVYEESLREIDFTNCSISRTRKLKVPVEMEYSEENWFSMEQFETKDKIKVA